MLDVAEPESEQSAEELLDKPVLVAELSAALMALLGLITLMSAVGLAFTVHPPGEQSLCQVETLGLQNETASRQQVDLAACHALYTGVFSILGLLSAPFFVCGLMAMVGGWILLKAVCPRDETATPKRFCCSAVFDAVAAGVVLLPSIYYPGVTAVVTAGMAPIHVYFLAIVAGHIAIKVSDADSGDEGLNRAAYTYEILYQGYCAASRVELCLTVGSIAIFVLLWVYILDFVRNLASILFWKPRYNADGSQILLAYRRMRAVKERLRQPGPTSGDETSPSSNA